MPGSVSWYYHRRSCETCALSQAFLERHAISVKKVADADEKFDAGQTLALARKAERVIAVRGRTVTVFDLEKDPPKDEALLAKLLGPFGNLRAPTLITGRTMVVGFHEAAYGEVFGV